MNPLLVAGLGFVAGFLTRWLLDRRSENVQRTNAIVDQYRKTVAPDADEYARMGTWQKAGAALLSRPQLLRADDMVTKYGLKSPTAEYTIFGTNKPFDILEWACLKNIDLGDAYKVLAIQAGYADWKSGRHLRQPPKRTGDHPTNHGIE